MHLLPVVHGPVSVCAGKLQAFVLHLLGEQRFLGGAAAGQVQLVLQSVLDAPDGHMGQRWDPLLHLAGGRHGEPGDQSLHGQLSGQRN